MISLRLGEVELTDIAEALDDPSTPDKFKRKLLAIRMHHQEVRGGVIASVLNISANTVTTYLRQYERGGLSEVLEDKAYRPSSSLEPFLDCLRCFFGARPPATTREAMAHIERLAGIRLSEEQTRRTLKKLGMSYRKCAQIPGKADPQQQFEFFTGELEPRLDEASRGVRKVFFVDAAHFVLGCFLGMVWSFSRLFVKGASGRQRYNVLGALDSHSKEVISLRTTEYINAEKVYHLMLLIRERHPEGNITLVMDNARYQRCKFVQEHARSLDIELLFLPAYSPNLNIIERLWKLVKTKCLRNNYFPKFEDFRLALDSFIDALNTKHQDELESLLTLKFQFFPNHN